MREDETVEKQLEKELAAAGVTAQVLNAGVGNYNAERYVSRFFKQLTGLNRTDVVVPFCGIPGSPSSRGNVFMRNSELAVTLWIAYHRLLDRFGDGDLVARYRKVYDPAQPSFVVMENELRKLARYPQARDNRLYSSMIPDVHDLVDYKSMFMHDLMRDFAKANGYAYVDLLPAMTGLRPERTWAMPGDPHPTPSPTN